MKHLKRIHSNEYEQIMGHKTKPLVEEENIVTEDQGTINPTYTKQQTKSIYFICYKKLDH